jgi:hypothetical protein
MLWTCAVLALTFLPRRSGQVGAGGPGSVPAGPGETGPDRAGLGI